MGVELAVLGAQEHDLPGLVGRYSHAEPPFFQQGQKAAGKFALERFAGILADPPGQCFASLDLGRALLFLLVRRRLFGVYR